ncbi:hypothetical protein EK21DRAFT_23071, partial [Setomelanomma holmii]
EQHATEYRHTSTTVKDGTLRYWCQKSNLGKNMVSTIGTARETLGQHMVDQRGYLILSTDIRIDRSEIKSLLSAGDPNKGDHIHGFEISRESGDFLKIVVDTTASSNVGSIADDWSSTEFCSNPEQEFQAWIDQSSTISRVNYLVGPPLAQGHWVNGILDSGVISKQRPSLPGINEPYWYVSQEYGTPATLHIEDAKMGSANLLLAGSPKLWLIIHQHDAPKLETCLQKEFSSNIPTCSQRVRHLGIIPSPRWLRAKKIRFEVVSQNPGEVFCTMPGLSYHAVKNSGKSFAVAIN